MQSNYTCKKTENNFQTNKQTNNDGCVTQENKDKKVGNLTCTAFAYSVCHSWWTSIDWRKSRILNICTVLCHSARRGTNDKYTTNSEAESKKLHNQGYEL